ncbi:MAG: YigZ family protein [Saprospiraceae bacterium]|nr:YigZ family protein [Saprospiraceae bacterium]
MKDTYTTIAVPVKGEYKEKGSKFIAYSFPVNTENEIKQRLAELRKEHNKARHHCYAYRLGAEGDRFRINDDGEPSGTAGRPILGQIDSFGLTNILSVVIRYFGGTKLGTSGLKRAYKEATKDAFLHAKIIEKIIKDQFEISFDYSVTSDVMNYLKSENITILETIYDKKAIFKIAIRQKEIPKFITFIKNIVGVKIIKL